MRSCPAEDACIGGHNLSMHQFVFRLAHFATYTCLHIHLHCHLTLASFQMGQKFLR